MGTRVITGIKVEEIFAYINERTLIGTQWQFRKNNVAPADYERQMREVAYPALERLKNREREHLRSFRQVIEARAIGVREAVVIVGEVRRCLRR